MSWFLTSHRWRVAGLFFDRTNCTPGGTNEETTPAFAFFAALAGASPALGTGLILNEANTVSSGNVHDRRRHDLRKQVGQRRQLDRVGRHARPPEHPRTGSSTGATLIRTAEISSSPTTRCGATFAPGTIITVREDDTGDPGLPRSVLARPTSVSTRARNDWWIEINADDPAYIIKNNFKVDNDNWQGRILDGGAVVQQGFVGEAAGLPYSSGSGINSSEVLELGATPTTLNPTTGYRDVTFSSYGAPNQLSPGVFQDFSALRAAVPEPSSIVLAAFAACGAALVAVRRRGRGR